MTSCEIASFVTAVGCVLFDCVEDEDLPLLAAVFTQLGAVIDTMVEQKNACEEREKKIEEKKAEEKKAVEKKETEKKGTKGNK